MRPNRSMAPGTIIPVLTYPDVRLAVNWLCDAFGFKERLRIGVHRAQLSVGDGYVVVAGAAADGMIPPAGQSVMVRVADVDAHFRRATAAGARVLSPPADFPFGERQFSVEDPWGHLWTFSQTVADVDPADWGGVLLE